MITFRNGVAMLSHKLKTAFCIFGISFLICSASGRPPVPEAEHGMYPVFEIDEGNMEQVVTVFPASGSGAGPARYAGTAGGNCIELPVSFCGNTVRATWDFRVKADLSSAQSIQFDFYCSNVDAASVFNLYFHSGRGWYSSSFSVGHPDRWNRIVLDKSAFRTEDRPQGWGKIDGFRIGVWRTGTGDGVAALANLGIRAAKPKIVVIQSDSLISSGNPESSHYSNFAACFSSTLCRLGVDFLQVSDFDLKAAHLASAGIAVLPCNPKLSQENLALLKEFTARGGKIFSAYHLADGIGEFLGLQYAGQTENQSGGNAGFKAAAGFLPGQPDFCPNNSWIKTSNVKALRPVQVIATWVGNDHRDSGRPAVTLTDAGVFFGHFWKGSDDPVCDRFMLALIGHFLPEVLPQTAAHEIGRIGNIGEFNSFEQFDAFIRRLKSPESVKLRDRLMSVRKEAESAMADQRWLDAFLAGNEARKLVMELWLMSRKAFPEDFRAVWCRAKGPGLTWDASAKMLAENGMNHLLVNMCSGGNAFYPSKVLPGYAELSKRGDMLKQCLEACRKYHIKVHVWRTCLRMDKDTSLKFRKQMMDAGRVQIAGNGKVLRGLCPSHPLNQRMEIDSMLELVRNYPDLAGIQFDYIRYSAPDSCFCAGCRERFEKYAGQKMEKWPDDFSRMPELNSKWLQFRRDNITKIVRETVKKIREVRPDIQISAAVRQNNRLLDRDTHGQDWELWCREGLLDFVCPMDYFDAGHVLRARIRMQKDYVHGAALYPGVGIYRWPQNISRCVEQIEIIRDSGLKGFALFEFDANMMGILPHLRKSILKNRNENFE